MGNDGGTIATQRSYVRGAKLIKKDAKKAADTTEGRQEAMKTCALSGSALNYKTDVIVACPYGRLYLKEAVVKCLLRRSQSASMDGTSSANEISHIRGLKDLYAVKFGSSCQCPVTGQDLSSGSLPCFVISSKKASKLECNVLSEKALKQMGLDSLQEDFGPFTEHDIVHLAPTTSELEKMKVAMMFKRENKAKAKNEKKKRKAGDKGNESLKFSKKSQVAPIKNSLKPSMRSHNAASIAQATVASAVAQNPVLSSLFSKDSTLSEKEKKDKLFATNGR